MLHKAMYKTRCKYMRKKNEKRRSIHGDNTNVLAKEFKPFAIKRFGEQVSLVIIDVNKLKSESTIFDKLPNKVMSNLYVFGSRMLLTNTLIMEELGATATGNDVLSFCSG